MTRPFGRRAFLSGVSALAVGSALTACSGGEAGTTAPSPSSSGSAGAAGGKVTLSYWAWGTAQPGLVKAWNKANPDVQVKHTDAGGGTDSATKMLTASRSGNAPDVAVVEYTTLPAMIVGEVASDITSYVSDIKASYTDATWGQTTFNGAIYGVPQDVGPMAFIYNQERFDKLGIKPPVTWQDFGTVAGQVRETDKKSYLAVFSPQEFGNFAGLAQQAGSQW